MSPLVSGRCSGCRMQNNMAAKKVFELNEASIVDLKAELIRKEYQLKREKFGEEQKVNRQPKKPPVWAKVKKETKSTNLEAPVQQNELSLEEQQLLQKSKQVLEAKAALYDKMAQGEIEDEEDVEGEGRFLVDFHRKVYSKEEESEQNSKGLKDEDIPPPSGPDEEWVDYVDSLGRERRCLRKDLKQLQDMDKDFTAARKSPPTLLSEDMRRELMRQQWEKEEEEAMNKPVGPLHYQDIRFDEIRTHGVGYYQFSTNEEERQEQMKALDKLREQTLEQRVRAQKLKEKRKAALDARLAKVRERKLKKLKASDDLSVETTEESVDTKDRGEEAAKGSYENERIEGGDEKLKTENEEERKFAALSRPDRRQGLPEWALHKIKQSDRRPQSSFIDPREERDDLFAPPAFYYEDNTSARSDKNTRKEPANLFRNEKNINERKEELQSQNQEARNQREQPQYQPQAQQSHLQQQQQPRPPEYPPLPPPPTQRHVQAAWTGYQWQPPPSIPPPPIPQQLPWQPNFPFNVPPPPPFPWQPNTFAWQSPHGSQPIGTAPLSSPHAFTTGNSMNSSTSFPSRGPASDTRQRHAHSVEHKDEASESNKTEERTIPSNQQVADFVAQFRS
ncbi:coiled-coil domain-containing protein 174-like [Acropora millepora]|uniref:coiled-coil domain-containing protein 174-like n=1 Tax=Acropora millepora TaxID=45264 RepID=UPI001CF5D9EF|nr:coiled-coil domain-containing protein 174-like [Acropora millepora]